MLNNTTIIIIFLLIGYFMSFIKLYLEINFGLNHIQYFNYL